MQSLRDDGVLIPCRVAGLKWDTVAAVLDSRFASGTMGRARTGESAGSIRQTDARKRPRLLRFWQVRPIAPRSEGELRGRSSTRQPSLRGAQRRSNPSMPLCSDLDCSSLIAAMTNAPHAALTRSALRCFSRGITSCFSRRSELCQASGLCL